MGKHRKPASRAALREASREKKPGGGLTLYGARLIGEGFNPEGTKSLDREIVAYIATRIFHAPVTWPDASDYPWVRLPYDTNGYSATLTGALQNYLKHASKLGQFARDPGLRETVEDVEKRSAKTKSTYLVIEERGKVTDCRMDQGECWPGPDSGRDGVVIIKTSGGAWPTFTEQVERDTALLAAMRTLTKVDHPFELYARSICYITDQGETAHPIASKMSVAYGGVRVTKPVIGGKVSLWADQLGRAGGLLVRASTDPAVNELLAAIRLDKAKTTSISLVVLASLASPNRCGLLLSDTGSKGPPGRSKSATAMEGSQGAPQRNRALVDRESRLREGCGSSSVRRRGGGLHSDGQLPNAQQSPVSTPFGSVG